MHREQSDDVYGCKNRSRQGELRWWGKKFFSRCCYCCWNRFNKHAVEVGVDMTMKTGRNGDERRFVVLNHIASDCVLCVAMRWCINKLNWWEGRNPFKSTTRISIFSCRKSHSHLRQIKPWVKPLPEFLSHPATMPFPDVSVFHMKIYEFHFDFYEEAKLWCGVEQEIF